VLRSGPKEDPDLPESGILTIYVITFSPMDSRNRVLLRTFVKQFHKVREIFVYFAKRNFAK
jgi:hypothetical protein